MTWWEMNSDVGWDCTLCKVGQVPAPAWGTDEADHARQLCGIECQHNPDGCEAFLYPDPGASQFCILLGRSKCMDDDADMETDADGKTCGYDSSKWGYYFMNARSEETSMTTTAAPHDNSRNE